jgi:hypothetical protein
MFVSLRGSQPDRLQFIAQSLVKNKRYILRLYPALASFRTQRAMAPSNSRRARYATD